MEPLTTKDARRRLTSPRRGTRLRVVLGITATALLVGSTTASAHAGRPTGEGLPGQITGDLEVVGHHDLGGDGFNAQITAHRGHAYVGGWGRYTPPDAPPRPCPSHGIRVVDLADPSQPEPVATFADGEEGEAELADTWTEKASVRKFRGRDIAAVGMHNCNDDAFRGFGLWDVSDPSAPERLALVRSHEPGVGGVQELWLEQRGPKLYLYTTHPLSELSTAEPDPDTGELVPGTPDFQIWDVTDPTDPVRVGEWGAWAELGIEPQFVDENGVTRLSLTRSATGAVAGPRNLVYVPYWDSGTMILDVSDPTNPTLVGKTEFEPQEAGKAHSIWLARGGNIMIETSEPSSAQMHPSLEVAWGYTRIYDISDPTDPVRLSSFEMPSTRVEDPGPGFWGVHDPKVRGNTMYLSYFAEGLVLADISRPDQPEQIAQFVPSAPDPTGFFCPGEECAATWGVELHRDLILLGDTISGIWVLKRT